MAALCGPGSPENPWPLARERRTTNPFCSNLEYSVGSVTGVGLGMSSVAGVGERSWPPRQRWTGESLILSTPRGSLPGVLHTQHYPTMEPTSQGGYQYPDNYAIAFSEPQELPPNASLPRSAVMATLGTSVPLAGVALGDRRDPARIIRCIMLWSIVLYCH